MGFARASRLGILFLALVAAGCADGPDAPGAFEGKWTPAPDIPTRVEVTCAADGTTTLSSDTLQPHPDGIHIRVTNEFDEPVSVEGFDASPGVTNWVFSKGPGTMELMCWPFSQHSSGEEPSRFPLEIVDPIGLFVDGTLPCEIESFSSGDFVEAPVDEGPPPLDVARKAIEGLRQDDILRLSGYPEQEGGSVIVIRDGEIVAHYGIRKFKGEPWGVSSGSACEGTGLQFEGESYG